MSAEDGGNRAAIVAAFLANLGIAVAKFVGFVVTGSSALLAESIHSVADASNQGLLVLGGRRARRAATPLSRSCSRPLRCEPPSATRSPSAPGAAG